MGSLVKKQAEKFLREKQRHRRWLAIFLCLALLVTSGTFAALRMDGRAMDDEENMVYGTGAHEHTAECYDSDGVLVCGQQDTDDPAQEGTGDSSSLDEGDIVQPETADEDLQQAESPNTGDPEMDQNGEDPEDPNTEAIGAAADPEDEQQDGKVRLEDVELTGDWRIDVIEIARSQIGRTEEASDPEGYERYVKWYEQYVQEHSEGDVYNEDRRGDWTSLFVSFCLDHANVEGIPLQADSRQWMADLAEESCGLYQEATYYIPGPGDIVFYELSAENEKKAAGEDIIRAGLVEEWNTETGKIKIVAGDLEKDGIDQVCETVYSVPEEVTILGYGQIPEKTQGAAEGTETGDPKEEGNAQEEIEREPEETQAVPEETQGTAEETQTIPEETQGAAEETQTVPEETQGAAEETQAAPDETQEPEETQVEADETQRASEEGSDDSVNMTIEELKMLGETQVGSTVYQEKGIVASLGATVKKMFRAVSQTKKEWSFDVYYVNRDENAEVIATDDFNLKYQMEFHTDVALSANAVKIRIPQSLLQDREGKPVTPTQIAVPLATKKQDGSLEWTESRTTPFNYYIEDGDLVFVNYKTITAGSNAAWQVLYQDMKIMDIKDETSWKLQAEITVEVDEGEPQTGSAGPLTGQVDSSVELVDVTKRQYKETGKIYTPGLYTESQVKRYIQGELPQEYAGENFSKWKYVVWEVTIKGKATQPWDLILQEDPFIEADSGKVSGKVVGYRNNTSSASGYGLPIGTVSASENTLTALEGCTERSWGNRFWVVTAYPADKVKEGDALENQITVSLRPVDGLDSSEESSGEDLWAYKDYEWTYSGDMIGVKKVSNPSEKTEEGKKQKDYKSWLEAYCRARENGEDYGDLYYSSEGVFHGYNLTHETSVSGNQAVGTYREGTSYELTTVDDYMYAYPDGTGNPVKLDRDDYYYSSVTIRQRDVGYDPSEDMETEPEDPAGAADLDKSVYVYAMLGRPDTDTAADKDGWTLLNGGRPLAWDASSGTVGYTFTQEEIAQEPWRVKVVHRTVEYETTCTIEVRVRLKHDSERLGGLADKYEKGELAYIQLEDLSGVMGRSYTAGDLEGKECHGRSDMQQYGKPVNYANYPGLEEESRVIYGVSTAPQRDNAYVSLYGLEKEAHAYKRVEKTTNDVSNSRVLVDYCLTAYDAYRVFDEEAADYLGSMGLSSPGQRYLMYYDLLPYGMYFDPSEPVTAGRITELDKNGYYRSRPGYWNSQQVTVAVDPKKDIIEDWNGTGRTMVIFHIAYSGADPAVYTDGKWMEGWGVSFRAYYEWKDTRSIKTQYNISAFMPDTQANGGKQTGLLGENSTVYTDGEVPDGNQDGGTKGIYDDLKGQFESDVLYADYQINGDEAVASSSNIEKTVRADADIYSTYSDHAYVEEGEDYTYNVTVTAQTSLRDIVVFDHLENAKTERSGITSDPNQGSFEEDEDLWYGTFRSVGIASLQEQGIDVVVWYNTKRNAATPLWKPVAETETGMIKDESQTDGPASVLTAENGWYQGEDLVDEYRKAHPEETENIEAKAFAEVKSIAVDLSKTAKQEDFILEGGQSLSFRIRMRAPETDAERIYTCAYNNPSFYSRPDKEDGVATTQTGDSVRVYLSEKKNLEVVKEFEGDVPPALQDTSFGFRIYRTDADGREQPLANKGYTLYVKDEPQTDRPYATDADGKFTLQAGQKAVFDKVAGVDNVQVEEIENIFWETKTESENIAVGEDQAAVSKRTITNRYRSVLYVQKRLEGVPENKAEEVKEQTFYFRIKVDGKTGKIKYCQVDRAALDGGIPNIIKGEDGGEVYKETDEDGVFEIKAGQIFALFVDKADATYELTELNAQKQEITDKEVGGDWICESPTVSGNVPYTNASASITNYYKWKDLYLTKEITHQDPSECGESFTFKISKIVGDGETVPIEGNEWVILDDNNDETDQNGKIDKNGEFTCACAGKTVLVKGLEAGTTYKIEEVIEEEGDLKYLPVNGEGKKEISKDVWMPLYSSSRDVTFINDYRMRSLSVSKMVVADPSQDPADPDKEFTMIVHKKNEDGSSSAFADKTYKVTGEDQEKRTDAQGCFTLKDGQTAVFENAGTAGSEFIIWEVQDEGYPQIYPSSQNDAEDAENTPENVGIPNKIALSETDMETEAKFINGKENLLLVSKEYVLCEGEEAGGSAEGYIQSMQGLQRRWEELGEQYLSEWSTESDRGFIKTEMIELRRELWRYHNESEGLVKARLTVNGEDWSPKRNDEIKIIEQITGDVYSAQFDPEKGQWVIRFTYLDGEEITLEDHEDHIDIFGSADDGSWNIMLRPWITYVLPMDTGTEYVLEEIEFDRGMIGETWDNSGSVVVSQKIPGEGESIRGTVKDDPVAKLVNEVRSADEDLLIRKYMTSGSDPVVPGAKMVWRVERYDGREWMPAEGIEYVIAAGNGHDYTPLGEVQKTKADGKIELIYPADGNTDYEKSCLAVQFFRQKVYLNLEEGAEEGALRVVEVPQETDDAWGVLAGYGIDFNPFDNYRMDVLPEEAVAFVNTNRAVLVDIEKKTEERFHKTFTMILRQKRINMDGTEESGPYQGISYTVYDKETDQQVGGKKQTNARGEIFLEDGQYARLYLPSELMWEVTEDVGSTPNFNVSGLGAENNSEGKVSIKGENLAFVNADEAWSGSNPTFITALDRACGVYDAETGKKVLLNRGDVVIPRRILREGEEYEVTGIDYSAFANAEKLTSMIIPDSVKTINGFAFGKCAALKDITIPDSVETIGPTVFLECTALEEIDIPNSVTSIGYGAFSGCTDLKNITIGSGLEKIPNSAFKDCRALTAVRIPGNITEIGDSAFENCSALISVDISEGVESIGALAFRCCGSLTEVDIPSSVRSIGYYAFGMCSKLSKVRIYNEDAQIEASAFDDSGEWKYGLAIWVDWEYKETAPIPVYLRGDPGQKNRIIYKDGTIQFIDGTRVIPDKDEPSRSVLYLPGNGDPLPPPQNSVYINNSYWNFNLDGSLTCESQNVGIRNDGTAYDLVRDGDQ